MGFKSVNVCVELPVDHHKALKMLCTEKGMTIKEFVIETLRAAVTKEKEEKEK